jgi:hypothetical protein
VVRSQEISISKESERLHDEVSQLDDRSWFGIDTIEVEIATPVGGVKG